MSTIFTVQVILTDRTRLDNGRYRTFRTNVDVMVDSADDAVCAAIQQASAIRADLDIMVLSGQIIDWQDS